MKPENLSTHKPSLPSGAAQPVRPSQVQLAAPVGQAHGTPTDGQIWLNGGPSSSAFGSSHRAIEPTNLDTSVDSPEVIGHRLGFAQIEETNSAEPILLAEPMPPLYVPTSVSQVPFTEAGRRTWMSISFGQITDAHFFDTVSDIDITMPYFKLKEEQATAILELAKITLQENGYPEAANASTRLRIKRKGERVVDIALILFSDTSDKINEVPKHQRHQRNAEGCEEDGDTPTPQDHSEGAADHSKYAEDRQQENVPPLDSAPCSVTDGEVMNATEETTGPAGHEESPEVKDRPSVADIAAAVLDCVMSPTTDELNTQGETQVTLSEEVQQRAEGLRDQNGGKKIDRPIEIEVDGQTCAKTGTGVWPRNPPAEPVPPTYHTVEVTCNGFKFNERVVYLNVSALLTTPLHSDARCGNECSLGVVRSATRENLGQRRISHSVDDRPICSLVRGRVRRTRPLSAVRR